MKNKFFPSIVLIIITAWVLFSPVDVFAGNNDSLPSYGFVGDGDELWKYTRHRSALRISIYWAPTHSDFEQGTDEVTQIGDTVDVSKTGPWYKVEAYTKRTIYWYMNNERAGKSTTYRERKSRYEPYLWTGLEEIFNSNGQDIVQLMPDVWDGTKEQWDNWFEGPILNDEKTYENIPEIARLCKAEITQENFKNGIYYERDFESKIGVYKIFFEPVIYPIVDGVPMAMTLRDLIRWEEAFWRGNLFTSDGKDLIKWITPVFVFTANSQFLIENEPSICMYGKSNKLYKEAYLINKEPLFRQNASLADAYQVYYGSPSLDVRRQQWDEIKGQLERPGGIIYNSMGVGVITTECEEEEIEEDEVIETSDQNTLTSPFETVVNAAPRDKEPFEVTDGIPSGENLYVQIVADSYVYHLVTNHVTGYVPTVVKVGHLDSNGYCRDSTIVVNRRYSYYEIKSFELYSIKDALVENDALPGKKVLITPSSQYKPPEVKITHEDDDKYTYHITGNIEEMSISTMGSTYAEVRAAAEAAVAPPTVKSDKLIINGDTIIDVETGLISTYVKPEKTDRDILYAPNLKIHEETLNGLYESKGIITYQKTYAFNPQNPDDTLDFDLENINSVLVHTPVCVDLSVPSDDKYNQHPSPAKDTSSLILGRPFTIDILNTGTHKDIKGYGSKDYSKYIKDREVRFGFDTYLGQDRSGIYLKAGIWHSLKDLGIDKAVSNISFYTPAWVDTGIYNVEIRNVATNNPANGTSEIKANLDPSNTMAWCEKKIEVSGRVFDLSITDIDDIAWETFFRTEKGSINSTQKAFYVGPKDINANLNVKRKYFLPVLPGKNDVPSYQNRAVKLGYAFKFEVKSIGDFYDYNDYLRIKPTFAFVDKDGKNRQEVDLYYQTPQSPLIKVGSAQDSLSMSVILDFEYRGIDLLEFKKTAGSMYRLRGGIKDYTQDKWIESFPKLSQIGVPTYKYTEILLTEPLRCFIGPKNNIPTGVNIDKAFASAQKWYGEYSLPSDCLIVAKGTDLSKERNLTRSSPIFLKEGYLLVNFKNISVGKNKNFNNPYLQYTGKTGDGWVLEGYDTNQGGWQLIDGDVLAYYANKRSTDDYMGTGTH